MSDIRTVSIDFLECAPAKERVYITYGSFAYEVVGKNSQGDCVVRYGGEVENPNLGEELATYCQIPESVGKMSFVVKDLGPDFSVISEYCKSPGYKNNSTSIGLFEIGVMGVSLVFIALCAYLVVSRVKVTKTAK